MKKDKNRSEKQVVRSSASEYLTFISAVGENRQSIELRYEDENIWMTQKMMAELYGGFRPRYPPAFEHIDQG